MSKEVVEKQAKLLAADNYKAEPDIERVYWFPDDSEVRLVELMPSIPIAVDGEIHPFYFRPSPEDNLPFASGIAIIRPAEFGALKLPKNWGDWNSAVLLKAEE